MTDSVGASPAASQRALIMAALRNASATTGADFGYLVKTAQRESNFDPTARASTSSATGLFQFTSKTWLSVVERYGEQHGVKTDGLSRDDILALRNDPHLSARMAGELAGENARILEKKLGRPATSAELYAAHFMGPRDAARLVSAARENQNSTAAEMFPQAALANASVFRGKGGASLSAAQLYTKLTGVDVASADAGRIPAAPVAQAAASNDAADPNILLQAQLGVAQLTSSLMTALFDLQSETRKG